MRLISELPRKVPEEGGLTQARRRVSAETIRFRRTSENVRCYADALVSRVQSGNITASDAIKELNEEAKLWDWTSAQKKFVKERLQGKIAERRTAQSDIATLLGELPRSDAQATIRSLDDPGEVAEALEGLGWGGDTNDVRQWLIDAPGMTEDILYQYAADPESSNRLMALRACTERFPTADLSVWFDDAFPFIAEKAKELQPGAEPPVIEQPAAEQPGSVPLSQVPGYAPEARRKLVSRTAPGAPPPVFPEPPESTEDAEESTGKEREKERKKGARGVPVQLTLTYDDPNEQYVMYDLDYGLVSPAGSKEKQIRGQLQAFGVDDARIDSALKEAKGNIVLIKVASIRKAQQDIQMYVEDAVQSAVMELSPEAPRANLMMKAMDKFSELTSNLGVNAEEYQNSIKDVLDQELDVYPRPEIPGTKQEFMQIADSEQTRTGRTYEGPEKRQKIKAFELHGIPLKETFEEKAPPEDIPPGRRLSVAESRDGFTVGDAVRDSAVRELSGIVAGFDASGSIRVSMNASAYCEEGSEGLYIPGGLINLGPCAPN